MAHAFISHSSKDNALARELHVWLRSQGFASAFLDIDENDGIAAGSQWEHTLHERIAHCQAVLLVLTPHWFASKWCFAEYVSARSAGKSVFPLMMLPCEGQRLAPELQHVDLVGDRAEGLRRLASALAKLALGAQGSYAWPADRVPYPGLNTFEADDAAVYFGREPEVLMLAERLAARKLQGGKSVVALLGASGSGKSSLVRAGVLPRLQRDRSQWLVLPPMRPRADPLLEWARVLALAANDPSLTLPLRESLLADVEQTLRGVLLRQAAAFPDASLLLTIDQAEELFTSTTDLAREPFWTCLHAALGSSLPLVVVLTMRSDMFALWQGAGAKAPRAELVSLPPMPVERLAEVIEGPARVAGFGVGPGLAAAITADAGLTDALPLVAFALRELYLATVGRRNAPARAITVEDYRRLGDAASGLSPLAQAVRRRADRVLEELALDPAGLQRLRAVFVERLVNLDAEGRYTRRSAPWNELDPQVQPLLDAFVQARLLIKRSDDNLTTVEVAHEALLRHWPVLVGWLSQEFDFLSGRRQLDDALATWQRARPDEKQGALLQGLLLSRATSWMAQRHQALTDDQRAFIKLSQQREQAEQAQQRRQRRGLVLAALAVLLLMAVGWNASRNAQLLERDLASQRLLRLSAAAIDSGRADRALVLAANADEAGSDARSRSALLQAGLALPPSYDGDFQLALAEGARVAAITALAWSAQDDALYMGDREGRVLTRPVASPAAARLLHDPGAVDRNRPRAVLSLHAGAQGRWSALRSDGVWMVQAGEAAPAERWRGPALRLASIAPDGAVALVLLRDAREWWWIDCTRPGDCSFTRSDVPPSDVLALAWSHDAKTVALPMADGRLQLLQRLAARVSGEVGEASPRRSAVLGIASRPGSSEWAVSYFSGEVRLLGAATTVLEQASPNVVATLPMWSADGQTLAWACSMQVCVWHQGLRQALPAHREGLGALSWSPRHSKLVSVDTGGRGVLWRDPQVHEGPLRIALPLEPPQPLAGLAWDAATGHMLAATSQGDCLLWRAGVAGAERTRPCATSSGGVRALKGHPLGTSAALVLHDGELATLKFTAEAPTWSWHESRVESAAWSSDGSTLYGGLADGRVMAFPMQTAKPQALSLAQTHAEAVLVLAVAPHDGVLWSADALGVLRRHDPQAGRQQPPLLTWRPQGGAAAAIDSLSFSATGQHGLLAGNHGDVLVFETQNSAAKPTPLETGAHMVVAAAFSPSGKWIGAIDDQERLHLWSGNPPFAAHASVSLRSLPGQALGDLKFALLGLRALQWVGPDEVAVATQSGHVLLLSVDAAPWLARARALGLP